MRALSLTEPWATLMAIGAKKIETRSWSTTYRGPLAIHVAKSYPPECRHLCTHAPFRSALSSAPGDASLYEALAAGTAPRGAIVAVADLVDCFSTDPTNPLNEMMRRLREPEFSFGNYSPGRFGFVTTNLRRLATPVPARGALQIWTVPPDIARQVEEQLRR